MSIFAVSEYNNNNNNRFIFTTIGPTRHSLSVTKGFLRLLFASYAPCLITFACRELQKLHIFCYSFLPHYIFHDVLSPYHDCFFCIRNNLLKFSSLKLVFANLKQIQSLLSDSLFISNSFNVSV